LLLYSTFMYLLLYSLLLCSLLLYSLLPCSLLVHADTDIGL